LYGENFFFNFGTRSVTVEPVKLDTSFFLSLVAGYFQTTFKDIPISVIDDDDDDDDDDNDDDDESSQQMQK